MISIHRFFTQLLLAVLCSLVMFAQPSDMEKSMSNKPILLNQWLHAGPMISLPPSGGEKPMSLKDHLGFEMLDIAELNPLVGEGISYFGKKITWKKLESADSSMTLGANEKQARRRIVFLATYLHVDRYAAYDLEIESSHLLTAYLNGKELAQKSTSEAEAKELKHTLKLERGHHLLIVKSLQDPELEAPWAAMATLTLQEKFEGAILVQSTAANAQMDISLLMEGPKVSGASISADGQLAAVQIRQLFPDKDKTESWVELHRVRDGKLLQTFRAKTALRQIRWAPKGQQFTYLTREKGAATLWLVDWKGGTTTPLLSNIKDLSSYYWSPNGKFIVYSVNEKAEADKRGVTRLNTPRERWPNFNDKRFLYRLDIKSGLRQRLTTGDASNSFRSISPDGRFLIFTTTRDDYKNRPYTKTTVHQLDLTSMKADTLFEDVWVGQISYSPDGKQLLVGGGPRLFDGIGNATREGLIPNDYDGQAYVYTLASGKAKALSKGFNPNLGRMSWRKDGKEIVLRATDGQYTRLYRHTLGKKGFKPIPVDVDVVNGFRLSDGDQAVYWGSNVSKPHRAFLLDLKSGKSRLLANPDKERVSKVAFGPVKDFNFKNSDGTTIEGRVYYPADFDPAKTYPAIVYYYGGTVSVTRDFGGRYPKNLFAAQGYIVYVPQPSGAIGYGQDFSALHVNDWGKRAAKDIIEGTEKFLAAHSFVDKERVGCIGASYGGFMTMSLLTQTDMFATGIAHAGISSLSSYWGEGFWGYLYSAAATANSFPWNRKDLYVDQSPLFNADKVQDPLLLLSGDSDTNVPRGESDQFYVALKLLGKTVEYVRVAGEDHHILTPSKRVVWQKTILAWFDRFLKDQPQWWDALYTD